MGSISQKAAVPLSPRRSKKRKRRHQEDYDEDSSPIFLHRRRRRSRSRTPSPSPSLAENDNIPEKDATANLPASLDRHACQRCLKFLASEPDFECEFPARSTKCTRCTRLKDKCEPVSSPHCSPWLFHIVTLRCARSPPPPTPKLVS